MKKYLLVTLICSCSFLEAQITITSSDIAPLNSVIIQSNDTTPGVTPGFAGASQVWNMAALADHYVDTLNFLPYSAAPNPMFSSANMVIRFGSQPQYAYGVINSSVLEIVGSHAELDLGGTPVAIDQVNTPAEKLAAFPITFSSSFSNNYSSTATFAIAGIPGVDSVRTTSAIQKSQITDAWGTLATPLGTFSVLRSMETKISHDTTEAYNSTLGMWSTFETTADSTTSYSFWANGVGFPLVSLTMDSTGTVSEAQWLKAMPSSISEHVSFPVSVFPNPASTDINFVLDATVAQSVIVTDVTGKVIAEKSILSERTNLYTGDLSNGVYFYTIIGDNNSIPANGKFIVAH